MSGRLDYINNLRDNNLFEKGIELGIVSTSWKYWLEVYEVYNEELSKGIKKGDAMFNTSQICNLSETRIYEVLRFFN